MAAEDINLEAYADTDISPFQKMAHTNLFELAMLFLSSRKEKKRNRPLSQPPTWQSHRSQRWSTQRNSTKWQPTSRSNNNKSICIRIFSASSFRYSHHISFFFFQWARLLTKYFFHLMFFFLCFAIIELFSLLSHHFIPRKFIGFLFFLFAHVFTSLSPSTLSTFFVYKLKMALIPFFFFIVSLYLSRVIRIA